MTVQHAEKPLNSVSASKEGVVHITENILLCTTPSFEALTNRAAANDNRLMIYFQGMKLYIPDGFQPDTLLKLLQVMKKL